MSDGKIPQALTDAELLMAPILDREHMQLWIEKFIGLEGGLPDCTVTSKANSNPLDFVYEVYRAVMDGKPLGILALAGRDSGKTLALSIIDLLVFLHDNRDGVHFAMTKGQGLRARVYLEQFIQRIPALQAAVVKQNNSKVSLNINGEEVGLEVLPCTPKAAQGAHAAFVSFDELASSMDPMNIRGYRDAHGVAGTSRKGKPAVIVKITSRQSSASLAEEELENAPRSGLQVRTWTTIDSMERCPDERSGTELTPLWINIMTGERYTEAEFEMMPVSNRDGFERSVDTRNKCFTCPIVSLCQGSSKKQTSTSPILRKVEDVISKYSFAGVHDWGVSQLMSLKPNSESLVYARFDNKIHVVNWDVMWERLTGEPPKKPGVTRQQWMERAKRAGITFIAGVDWGWTSPSTCVVLGIDRRDNVYVVEARGALRKDDAEWVKFIKDNIHQTYDVQMYCPDSESKSGVNFFRKEDLPVVDIDKGPGSVLAGVNLVRGFVRVPGTNKETKLFIASDIVSSIPNVPGIIEEFAKYSKEVDAAGSVLDDKFKKGFDHYLDALRYCIYWYFGKATVRSLMGEGDTRSLDSPNADMVALAKAQGINFNDNRQGFDHMGPQADPDDDDDDDDDPNKGGGGSGLQWAWT